MMHFVWFCASGDSFFLGAGLMILAVMISFTGKRRSTPLLVIAQSIVGLVLIVLAALPFHLALYAMLTVCTLLLIFCHGAGKSSVTLRLMGQTGILILCALGAISESAFRMEVNRPQGEPLYVIGDSVSAGIQGPNEATWPKLLAARHNITVVNLAESGATVATAGKQARQIGDGPGLVLLEIGGNDLFAPTPPHQFQKDLTRLLEQVIRPNRTVVMLELPVLPWQIRYSRIQRKLAKSVGIILVPKRFFVRVLRQEGATLDLAHLSAEGHRKMANEVATLLRLSQSPR